ncbi:MAG: GspH/FimT family protein [Planctomycetota bacterium]
MEALPSLPVTPEPRQSREPFSVSFLGLALVLLVISAIAAVGIPMWFAQPRITLKAAADLLVQDMQHAQGQAMLSYGSVRIEFDADGGGYSIYDAQGTALESPMGDGPYRRDYRSDAVWEGVHVRSADFGGKTSLVVHPSGLADVDGEVEIEYKGETRRVRFEAGSAMVLPQS